MSGAFITMGWALPLNEAFITMGWALSLICDPVSENPALPGNIKFELEAILSVQVVFQLNSDYCTKALQGACTVSY